MLRECEMDLNKLNAAQKSQISLARKPESSDVCTMLLKQKVCKPQLAGTNKQSK